MKMQRWMRTRHWYSHAVPGGSGVSAIPEPGMAAMILREALTEDAASEEFFAAYGNWYGSSYGCRTCKRHLYKTVFPEGNELEIATDDPANSRIRIKRVFSCARCQRFVTTAASERDVEKATERARRSGGTVAAGLLGDPNNFEYQCESEAEYLQMLRTTDSNGTTVGRQDAGFIRLVPNSPVVLGVEREDLDQAPSSAPRVAPILAAREAAGDARAAADAISAPHDRASALAAVSVALAVVGEALAGREAASAALAAADTIHDPPHVRASSLSNVAVTCAAAGDMTTARAAIDSIGDPHYADKALGRLAHALADARDIAAALAAAEAIDDLRNRAYTLISVAKALAEAGDPPAAREVAAAARAAAEAIDYPRLKALVLVQSAETLADAGDAHAARETAAAAGAAAARIMYRPGEIDNQEELSRIAAVQAAIGDGAAARATVAAIPRSEGQAYALAGIAEVLAAAGEVTAARQAVAEALALSQTGWVLTRIAPALAAAGDAPAAQAAAEAIDDGNRRNETLAKVAEVLVDAGDVTAAWAVADSFPITWDSFHDFDDARTRIALALAAAGHSDAARTVAAAIQNSYWRAPALSRVAQSLAAAGDPDAAMAAVDSIDTDSARDYALRDTAVALATAGDTRAARDAVEAIYDIGSRARALIEVARALAANGYAAPAADIATHVRANEDAIDNPVDRVYALVGVAEVLAKVSTQLPAPAGPFTLGRELDQESFRRNGVQIIPDATQSRLIDAWFAEQEAWFAERFGPGYSSATLITQREYVRRAAGDLDLLTVGPAELAAWASTHDWSPATRRQVASALRSFADWLVVNHHRAGGLISPLRDTFG